MNNSGAIFVIDDDVSSLAVLKKYLTSMDMNVHTYTDARIALKQINNLNPSVVVVDIFMPHMDGLEVIKTLRHNGYEGMIISISQGAVDADIDGIDVLNISKIFGADEAIPKPIEFGALQKPIVQYQASI